MTNIAIISASVRTGRKSHRVALFFQNYLAANGLATTELLDLNAYQFPVFNERLKFQKDPSPELLDFTAKIKAADGVIIVTPEYNGGYPAALKNVTDVLYDEWRRKPIAISTVSDGPFGGMQVITSLQFSLWKIRAWTDPRADGTSPDSAYAQNGAGPCGGWCAVRFRRPDGRDARAIAGRSGARRKCQRVLHRLHL